MTKLEAMPGLNSSIGSIQMEADPVAIKHPIFPPYSGGEEITGITLLGNKQIAQISHHVELQWKAYEVQRFCHTAGLLLESRTALLPEEPLAGVELTITNEASHRQEISPGFIFSGRSRNTGNEGYAWAVPAVPTTVSAFNSTEGLYQRITEAGPGLPGGLLFENHTGNGYSVQCADPVPDQFERGRIARYTFSLGPGQSVRVVFLFSFHEDKAKALSLVLQWRGRSAELFTKAQQWWEHLWQAAFTPNNGVFSGYAPVLESRHEELLRTYYNAILTQLTCRRTYPHAVVSPCYLTLWPRRGEGSVYLTWEMPYTAGLLSKLDPEALHSFWTFTAQAPFLQTQVANYFEREFGGWTCGGHPQTLLSGALNLSRWAGDNRWQTVRIVRKLKKTKGFEAASQNQIVGDDESDEKSFHEREMRGWDVFKEALFYHRERHLPGSILADVGERDGYLECVTTYAHATAALSSIQAWALAEAAPLLNAASGASFLKDAAADKNGSPVAKFEASPQSPSEKRSTSTSPGPQSENKTASTPPMFRSDQRRPSTPTELRHESERLLQEVLTLYNEGQGYFSCRFPDGSVYGAANLYDIGVVLSTVGERLPQHIVEEIAKFARDNLITPTWSHCLRPVDPDVVSGMRCDHQWVGCFAAWPAQFIYGLLRAGYSEEWVTDWVRGISHVTRQGPYGQAYWAEDVYPPEAGAAAKCFDELTQGNHWVIQSGVHFFDTVVEGILGLSADLEGDLSVKPGLAPFQQEATLRNIRVHDRNYNLEGGVLREVPIASTHEDETSSPQGRR